MDADDPRALVVEWTATDTDQPILSVRVPEGEPSRIGLDVSFRLGPIVVGVSMDPVEVAAMDTSEMPVDLALAGWMHEAAATYLTDVQVTVFRVDESGSRLTSVSAPALFLACPDGEAGRPVGWTRAEVDVHAPHGVLDAELQAMVDTMDGDVWIHPPLWDEVDARSDVDTKSYPVALEVPPMDDSPEDAEVSP